VKVCVNERYGSPDVLRFCEIEAPVPKKNEVRIKIHATSINGSDREGLLGKPLYARIGGLRRPKNPILGSDIAGVVDAVGEIHEEFKLGDRVFGELPGYHGGFAEYVCTDAHTLAHIPDGLSFVQAAAIPQAGVIAYNGIYKQERVRPGQKVLINGAGGSGGSFAIQLATENGAEVTGVDNSHKLDFIRSLGAHHVIDYKKQDFTQINQQYDLILDLIADRSAWAYPRALCDSGRYAVVGGSTATLLQVLVLGPIIKWVTGKTVRILAVPQNRADLCAISDLVASGQIKPSIDQIFAFAEIPEAMRYIESGESKGKVIVQVV